MDLSRRDLLAFGGLSAGSLALLLSGCARSSNDDGGNTADGNIEWWDHFAPLEGPLLTLFERYSEDNDGAEVTRTVYNPAEMGPALQLAQSSNQLPDVFTALFGIPERGLVDAGLVAPFTLSSNATEAMEGQLFEGLHTFDGDVYSLPLFTARQHTTLTWFDTRLVEQAGGDPTAAGYSWDEFRRIARSITSSGVSGWVTNLAYPDRLEAQVFDLAQAAGQAMTMASQVTSLPTSADPATGEYPYDNDIFVSVLEYLRSLVDDGVMFASSTSLDAIGARARWAAGEAGIFFDGPWNAGVIKGQFPDFLPNVGVVDIPSPEGRPRLAKGPAAGQFWLSATSPEVDGVSDIFSQLASSDFAKLLAERMDQPPANLSVVTTDVVHPIYARAVELFQQSVTLTPSPVVKNPATARVFAEMEEVRPTLGEIAAGYLGGDIDDVASALTTFRSNLAAERDRAITAVGSDVSIEDWTFPSYEYGSDFEANDY